MEKSTMKEVLELVSFERDKNGKLQIGLQELIKCIECDGTGGKREGSTGRLGHPLDPQTWINCPTCDGEGWVKA